LKIAVAGAGLTGSYLYRLLVPRGHEVDLYDRPPWTKCGINPCAWGTSRGFAEFIGAAGLDAATYVLAASDHVVIDQVWVKADIFTFDKQRLIGDLRQGATIRQGRPDFSKYDRIVDCTGVSRAFLPPVGDDVVLPCVQYRVRTEKPLENEIRLRAIGYSWCFPLSPNEYHVGCGSLVMDPRKIIKELGWAGNGSATGEVLCGCNGKIRLTAPQYSQPFVARIRGREVWGVGEAVGCVAPLAGDGIVPGMRSVQILLEWWDKPDGYAKALLDEFSWMKNERRVIDKLRTNREPGLRDAWTLKKNSRRMAMKVGLKEALALMRHLR
jgi:flavin-dependent dehydrogenase